MAEFDAIDALLAAARQETPLPPAGERRRLREELNLSRAQLAQALGVSASTVAGWEAGREPGGEVREKYAYFLEGARTKLDAAEAGEAPADAPTSAPASGYALASGDDGPAGADQTVGTDDDAGVLSAPQPCVLCGQPARHQVEGFPQHLDPTDCGTAAPVPQPAQPEKPAPRTAPRQPALARTLGGAVSGVKVVPVGRRVQAASDTPDLIGSAVAAALAEHAGDVEAATAALVKRAIPDAMALLDDTRKGGRYDVVAHPWLPDILRKQSARGADQVWEARPKWSRPRTSRGRARDHRPRHQRRLFERAQDSSAARPAGAHHR